MIDKKELQRLAEACHEEPLRLVEYSGTMYLRNTAGTVFEVRRNRSFPQFVAINEAHARFVEAATPVVVLDMLAEIAVLREAVEGASTVMVCGLCDLVHQPLETCGVAMIRVDRATNNKQ